MSVTWQGFRCPLAWLLPALLAAVVCVAGCHGGDDGASLPKKKRLPGDPKIVPRRPIEYPVLNPDGTPLGFAETKYPDGTPTHYADGNPTYYGNGEPIDYRRRNILITMAEFPTLYLRADTGEPVILPGDVTPRKDPASGAVCWRAYVCTNTNCPGAQERDGPYLYAPKLGGVVVGKSGFLVWPGQEDEVVDPELFPDGSVGSQNLSSEVLDLTTEDNASLYMDERCPACNQRTAGPYELPEVAKRRVKLEQDLKKLRAEKLEQFRKKQGERLRSKP